MLLAVLLAVVTLAAFSPVLDNGFICLDDGKYVVANGRLAGGFDGQTVRWAFTTFHAANWHPVTWLSHIADVALFGLRPRGHHLTSLLVHAVNVVLCLAALKLLTGSLRRSVLVAALFAVHPLRVESVAWVAERKDVLCGFFWFAALIAYVRYARRPCAVRYGLLVALFAIGLMAKPMMVTLPLVLLLLDYWPLGRLSFRGDPVPPGTRRPRLPALLFEKVPLVALAAIASAVTYQAQLAGAMVKPIGEYPPGVRIANALAAYASYIGKTIWPASLAIPYPHPGASLPAWRWIVALALLLSLSAAAVAMARRRPWLLVGWLWFLGALLPVVGFVQLADQAMADRYTYLPALGLLIAAAWAVPSTGRRRPRSAAGLVVGAALVIAALAALCHRQASFWRDDVTLFGRAIAVTADNALARYNLGTGLARRGDIAAAIPQFREALRIRPDFGEAHYNLAKALEESGSAVEAVDHYQEAVRIMPGYLFAINNLGGVLLRLGRAGEAARWFAKAVQLAPGDPDLRYNLELALARERDARPASPR